MLESINQLDAQIFLFFNGLHNSYFDMFMKLFTMRFVWVPMYATMLFIIFRRFPHSVAFLFTCAVIVSIIMADQTCATLIRPYVGRMRPSNLSNPLSAFVHIVDGYRGGSYGFPSCHAANSFALAVIMSLIVGRTRFTIFICLWAALNSYSRLYLGVHYPGDLLTGALVGTICALLCYSAARIIAAFAVNDRSHLTVTPPDNHRFTPSDITIMSGLATVLIIGIISFF